MTVACLRCGKCCHYIEDGILKKCSHLVKLGHNKTLCRQYIKRLGKLVGKHTICGLRSNSDYDYLGCPLNTNKDVLF